MTPILHNSNPAPMKPVVPTHKTPTSILHNSDYHISDNNSELHAVHGSNYNHDGEPFAISSQNSGSEPGAEFSNKTVTWHGRTILLYRVILARFRPVPV